MNWFEIHFGMMFNIKNCKFYSIANMNQCNSRNLEVIPHSQDFLLFNMAKTTILPQLSISFFFIPLFIIFLFVFIYFFLAGAPPPPAPHGCTTAYRTSQSSRKGKRERKGRHTSVSYVQNMFDSNSKSSCRKNHKNCTY